MKGMLLPLAGAVVGGIVGYITCEFLWHQGFMALAVPGGFLGLGAGVAKNNALAVPIACGIAATVLGIYVASQLSPFFDDDSLGFFVRNLHKSSSATQIMIGVGGFLGFYFPFRNRVSAPKKVADG
jgi:hypothetical protein